MIPKDKNKIGIGKQKKIQNTTQAETGAAAKRQWDLLRQINAHSNFSTKGILNVLLGFSEKF